MIIQIRANLIPLLIGLYVWNIFLKYTGYADIANMVHASSDIPI